MLVGQPFLRLSYQSVFFIHLKPELLTQFPASNEWKIFIFCNYKLFNFEYLINLSLTKIYWPISLTLYLV